MHQTQFLEKKSHTEGFPNWSHTHCATHVLNLCVMKRNISEVQNAMDIGDKICRFFAVAPKRQLAFEKWVHQLLKCEQRKKLKSICKTRWVERHEAFEVFLDLYQPLVYCLEDIRDSNEWNHDSRTDVQSFLLVLSRFPFIFALVVIKEVYVTLKA